MLRPLVRPSALSWFSQRGWATATAASPSLVAAGPGVLAERVLGRAPALPERPSAPAEQPAAAPRAAAPWQRRRLETVIADGWTPLPGKVLEASAAGIIVDVGCARPGLLPAHGHFGQDPAALAALQPGQEVTVYANLNQRGAGERKLTLSLTRRDRPRLRWRSVLADGLTPYPGVVSNIVDYGAFVDFGCEVQGLLGLPRLSERALDALRIGNEVVVYVWGKHPQTRKLDLSLERRCAPLLRLGDVCADGRTAYQGMVMQVKRDIGAFIDIGAEISGLLPAKDWSPDEHSLSPGDKVEVYVVKRNSWNVQLTLALEPLLVPQRPVSEVVADGQTPYRGVIKNVASFGSFVDFGFEAMALLPARDALEAPGGPPQVGAEVVVYAVAAEPGKDRVTVSLQRSPKPLERFQALVADGCTPYRGHVVQIDCGGIFVDIGSERAGFLPPAAVGEGAASLQIGDELTVYIAEKSPHNMRLWLSLHPRERPLAPLHTLVVDGQTPHEGVVRRLGDVGASVDLGLERSVLLSRDDRTGLIAGDDGTVAVGARVVVYAQRWSSATGKVFVTLMPSPERRIRRAEVAVDKPSAWYSGSVYATTFDEILVDFGCEISGVVPFSEVPTCARGDTLRVRAVAYNPSTDRFALSTHPLAEELPDGQPRSAVTVDGPPILLGSPPPAGPASEALDAAAQAESAAGMPLMRTAGAEGGEPAVASSGALPDAQPGTEKTSLTEAQRVEAPVPPLVGRTNFKGRLQEAVMAVARVPLRKGDISYASERSASGLFAATVSVRDGLPKLGGLRATGEPRRSKADAEQAAAQVALAQVASF